MPWNVGNVGRELRCIQWGIVGHPDPFVTFIEDPSSSIIGGISRWWVCWEDEVHLRLWIHRLEVVVMPRILETIGCYDRWHVGCDRWLVGRVWQWEGWYVRARVGCVGLTC